MEDAMRLLTTDIFNPISDRINNYIVAHRLNFREDDTITDSFAHIWYELGSWYRYELAIQNLEQIYAECKYENWDGYGAIPISENTYGEAKRMLKMIPLSFPIPDILPEQDGGIGFEWYLNENCSFTISLSGNNILNYAGFFDEDNETYGKEKLADSIPNIILAHLKRLFNLAQ